VDLFTIHVSLGYQQSLRQLRVVLLEGKQDITGFLHTKISQCAQFPNLNEVRMVYWQTYPCLQPLILLNFF